MAIDFELDAEGVATITINRPERLNAMEGQVRFFLPEGGVSALDAPGKPFDDPAAERARTESRHPVGRLGTPHEIGGLCAYLCSPYSRFITGTTILIDGGRSALMQDT